MLYIDGLAGNNVNNGLAPSPQAGGVGPWKDLSKAAGMRPGDIAYVRNGTYTAILNSSRRATFYVQSRDSGEAGFPKALVAYPGRGPAPARDINPIVGDPLYTDAAAGIFSLRPCSPMYALGALPTAPTCP
ncbi:MAG: hypothetical protein ACRDGA_04230 [Bacteroidota bacterium]